TDGAPRRYSVRTVNSGYEGPTSSEVTGFRGAAPTYQWQRSSGDADADYTDLVGATTDVFDDTTVPLSGEGRFYRCLVTVDGGTPVPSTPARGARLAVPNSVPRDDLWITNGTVNDFAVEGETLYIAGRFDYVGPSTGSFAQVDATTGALTPNR